MTFRYSSSTTRISAAAAAAVLVGFLAALLSQLKPALVRGAPTEAATILGFCGAMLVVIGFIIWGARDLCSRYIEVEGDTIRYIARRGAIVESLKDVALMKRHSSPPNSYYEVRFLDGKKLVFWESMDQVQRLVGYIEHASGKRFER